MPVCRLSLNPQPPTLTPIMTKEMLINASEGEECRIAVVEDGRLQELYMERTSSTSHVGNIYKGKVTNVEASIQAAFIDFGLGRNGFLHISDLMPSYFGKKHEDVTEAVGRKISRRDRPPIQRCLKRGDEIVVQIIKEGIGTKGPTLSTYVSIPGRILVMMPGMSKFGISRKIEDDDERRRLRGILDGLKCPDDVGFIVRTAGVGKNKAEISRDLLYLTRLWKNINDKLKQPAPQELYTEGDLVTRTVRDVFSSDIDQIVVDSKDVAKRIKEFFKIAMPRTKNRVELYEDPIPLFHKYKIEHEIEQIYSRHVPLPSGGSLVIDSTEAIVAIDVNSGKFRDHSDAETTAFKTDMEAADEIPRQLKLRDLGGVIICDFIDLRFERHRRELEQRLHENLKSDRAKSKVLRMSQFGIVEMTRQRMRPSLKKSIYCDCPHCKGSGLVKTPESMSLDMMRRLMIAMTNDKVVRIEMAVHPEVAYYLLNRKRQQLSEMEAEGQKNILVRHDSSLALDEFKLMLYDGREGLVFLSELGIAPPHTQPLRGAAAGARPKDGGAPRRGENRGDSRPNQQQRHEPPKRARPDEDEDRFELEDDDTPEPRRETSQREPDDGEPSEEIAEAPVGRKGPAKAPRKLPPKLTLKPPARGRRAPREEPPEEDEPSQVVDVEDGTEPMGEAPRGYDDHRDDRGDNRSHHRHDNRAGSRPDNRGGDNRNADNRGGDNRNADNRGGDNRGADNRGLDNRNADNRNADNGGDDDRDADGGPRRGRRRRRRRGGRGRGADRPEGERQGPPLPPIQQGPNRPARPPVEAKRPVGPGVAMGDHGDEHGEPMHNDIEAEVGGPGNTIHSPPYEERPRDDDDGKKRRRRGGRRHRERRDRVTGRVQGSKPAQPRRPEGLPSDEELDAEAAALDAAERRAVAERGRVAPKPLSPPPTVNIVKTGSADKHLADDEPADHEPVARPRSYRDLDALPDYDE